MKSIRSVSIPVSDAAVYLNIARGSTIVEMLWLPTDDQGNLGLFAFVEGDLREILEIRTFQWMPAVEAVPTTLEREDGQYVKTVLFRGNPIHLYELVGEAVPMSIIQQFADLEMAKHDSQIRRS